MCVCIIRFINVVIEVQIPTEEDLMNVESVDFPSILNTTSNNVFNEMTPMIQIPAPILTNQIRDQGCKNKIHTFTIISFAAGRRVAVVNIVTRNVHLPTNPGYGQSS